MALTAFPACVNSHTSLICVLLWPKEQLTDGVCRFVLSLKCIDCLVQNEKKYWRATSISPSVHNDEGEMVPIAFLKVYGIPDEIFQKEISSE